MCKPHRCPHINMTGNICVYCPGGPDSDFEYSTQSYTGYEPTSMRAIRARFEFGIISFFHNFLSDMIPFFKLVIVSSNSSHLVILQIKWNLSSWAELSCHCQSSTETISFETYTMHSPATGVKVWRKLFDIRSEVGRNVLALQLRPGLTIV